MIVVCSLHPSGHVEKHAYTKNPVDPSVVPPWGTPLEWAMRIAGQSLRELRRPSWIERQDQPASRPTIERGLRNKLRFTPPAGGTH